jgi:hypothetical protein
VDTMVKDGITSQVNITWESKKARNTTKSNEQGDVDYNSSLHISFLVRLYYTYIKSHNL